MAVRTGKRVVQLRWVVAIVLATGAATLLFQTFPTGARAVSRQPPGVHIPTTPDSAVMTTIFVYRLREPSISITSTQTGSYSWSLHKGQFFDTTTSDGSTMDSEEVIDGDNVYTRFTYVTPGSMFSTEVVPGGWSKAVWRIEGGNRPDRLVNFMNSLSFDGLLASAPPEYDRASILAVLRSSPAKVHEMGKGQVGGVDAVRYVAAIPYSDLGPQTASTQAVEHALGGRNLNVDYWVDSHGRLRQLQVAISVSHVPASKSPTVRGKVGSFAEAPLSMSVQLRVADYGVAVSILVPPPQSVTTTQRCVLKGSNTTCG